MKPLNLKTKIFLDSGDPAETSEAFALLGFLDGQTTNPSLIAKNPEAQKRLTEGQKFTKEEVYAFYKQVVNEISRSIPEGSISIEVYADKDTTAEMMLIEARQMYQWIPNGRIKFPTNTAGLAAARSAVDEGMRINMTLCFTQEQSAAVYVATQGASRGAVYISPFIGRLDDVGENGMDYVKNTIELYKKGDGHVEILTASVRNMNHFLYAVALGSDIITAPLKLLKEWASMGFKIPRADFVYQSDNLRPIEYKELNLTSPLESFEVGNSLLTAGIEKFSADWNKLLK